MLFWIIVIPLLFYFCGKLSMWLDYNIDLESDISFWIFLIASIFGVYYVKEMI